MNGKILKFPLSLKAIDGLSYKHTRYENIDDLISEIYNYSMESYNSKKPLKEILEDMGLADTLTLVDERCLKLIELYKYYSSNATPPAPFTSKIWYDTVVLLETFSPNKGLF